MTSLTLDLSHARATPAAHDIPNLAGMTRAEMATALTESGVIEPSKVKMRASQLWRWMHIDGATDFARTNQRLVIGPWDHVDWGRPNSEPAPMLKATSAASLPPLAAYAL